MPFSIILEGVHDLYIYLGRVMKRYLDKIVEITCKEILLEINEYNYVYIGNSYTVIQLWSSS